MCSSDLVSATRASCTYATTALTPGTHAIGATYAGDGNFRTSSAPTPVTQVIRATTTTTLGFSPASPVFGQSVTFVATVATDTTTATGTVTFTEGATTLGSCTLVDGQCLWSTSTLTRAAHTIAATYAGDAGHAGSGASTALTVGLSPTTLSLSVGPAAVTYGASQTLAVTITSATGVPTGTVTFTDGTRVLGTCTLTAGACSIGRSDVSAGSRTIGATYASDGNYASSAATAAASVAAAPTATSLAFVTAASVPYATTVRYRVTVATAAGAPVTTPTGTVTILDGTTGIGSCTLNGSATCDVTTATLAAGTHAISAVYAGAANHAGSASDAQTQTVTTVATTTTIASSASSISLGGSVTLTVSVASSTGPATGSVTVTDGTATLGSCTLAGTGATVTCTVTAASLGIGTHVIGVRYPGDGNYLASAATPVTVTVTSSYRGVSSAASSSSSTSLAVAFPAGTVAGDGLIASVAVANGNATITTAATSPGWTKLGTGLTSGGLRSAIFWRSLTAGDSATSVTFSSSVSGMMAATLVAVNGASTMAPTAAEYAEQVSASSGTSVATPALSGLVRPGIAIRLGAAIVAQGTSFTGATGATFLLSAGTKTAISGIARGDWTSATSLGAGALTTNAAVTASIGQTVFLNQRRTASTTTLAVSPAGASVVGRAVTLTATVVPSNGPGVPTGTVSFSDGTTPLGACTLDAAGTCSISVSNLAAGAHSLTAAYAQDVSFAGSSSSALAYTITRYPVGIAVSPSANPAQYGATVGFTVRVDATTGAAPTGTVSLFDGTAGVGTCALVAQDATSASCVISSATLAGGLHAITASYGGDATFATATSAALTQEILATPTTTATPEGSTARPLVHRRSPRPEVVVGLSPRCAGSRAQTFDAHKCLNEKDKSDLSTGSCQHLLIRPERYST